MRTSKKKKKKKKKKNSSSYEKGGNAIQGAHGWGEGKNWEAAGAENRSKERQLYLGEKAVRGESRRGFTMLPAPLPSTLKVCRKLTERFEPQGKRRLYYTNWIGLKGVSMSGWD